jgi:hypothetical protein
MKNVIICYIAGLLALFLMLVCTSSGEYVLAFVLSIVQLTLFVVGNFIQSERILKKMNAIIIELCKTSHDLVLTKNSIEFIGTLSNRNMIDTTMSLGELTKEINEIKEQINITLKSN